LQSNDKIQNLKRRISLLQKDIARLQIENEQLQIDKERFHLNGCNCGCVCCGETSSSTSNTDDLSNGDNYYDNISHISLQRKNTKY